MRNPNTKCHVCAKSIYKRPKTIKESKNIFCSQKCFGISCRKPIKCKICDTEILASKNKNTCSKECFDIALKDKNRNFCKGRKKKEGIPKHGSRSFRKRILELRGDKCEICKYSITEVLTIHHIVERSKGGLDIDSNLLLICRNCHGEIHTGHRNADGSPHGSKPDID